MAKGLHKNSLRKVDNPHQWMIDDARMELIQKIKAEVERRKTIQLKRIQEGDLVDAGPYDKNEAYNELLDFLSDLEKEEKPMNLQPVDLDDAINNWQGIEAFPEGCGITPLPKAMKIVDKTARHFYELGRQSGCVKVKAESSIDKFILENCTHCTIEHCPGMRKCYTSSNKQLQ